MQSECILAECIRSGRQRGNREIESAKAPTSSITTCFYVLLLFIVRLPLQWHINIGYYPDCYCGNRSAVEMSHFRINLDQMTYKQCLLLNVLINPPQMLLPVDQTQRWRWPSGGDRRSVPLTFFWFAGEGWEGEVHDVQADDSWLQQAWRGLHCRDPTKVNQGFKYHWQY